MTATIDRTRWQDAVNEYERAHAKFNDNWAAYEAAERAAEKECPPRSDFHDYGLRVGMEREVALIKVDLYLDARDRPANYIGADRSDDEVDCIAKEAEHIVDEFFAYVAAREECWDRHRVNQLRSEHHAFVAEVFDPAREKVLATPAPDIAALLFKADLLATMYDEGEGLRDDAKRLLTSTSGS